MKKKSILPRVHILLSIHKIAVTMKKLSWRKNQSAIFSHLKTRKLGYFSKSFYMLRDNFLFQIINNILKYFVNFHFSNQAVVFGNYRTVYLFQFEPVFLCKARHDFVTIKYFCWTVWTNKNSFVFIQVWTLASQTFGINLNMLLYVTPFECFTQRVSAHWNAMEFFFKRFLYFFSGFLRPFTAAVTSKKALVLFHFVARSYVFIWNYSA